MKKLTEQFSQQGPVAHSASLISLQVIGSQHGSFLLQSSKEPQSHSSPSSTIPFPQFLLTSSCNGENYFNMQSGRKFANDKPHWVYLTSRGHDQFSTHLCNRFDCTLRTCMAERSPIRQLTATLYNRASLCRSIPLLERILV